MLNSRQKLTQELLNKKKEPEQIFADEIKPELNVIPPKFKRPQVNNANKKNFAKKDFGLFENNDDYVNNNYNNNNFKSNLNLAEGIIEEIEKRNVKQNEIGFDDFRSPLEEEESNKNKEKDDFYSHNDFEDDNIDGAQINHFYYNNDLNKENSNYQENKSSANLGLIGGIIGKSNDLLENATSQFFNFLGNLTNNLKTEADEENQEKVFERKNLNSDNEKYSQTNETHNQTPTIDDNFNKKEANFRNLVNTKKNFNENETLNNKKTEILNLNQQEQIMSLIRKDSTSKENQELNNNEYDSKNNKNDKINYEHKQKLITEFDHCSNYIHKENDREKIKVLEKEIKHLRNIVFEYKSKEIENSESIRNLEITNLKNIIKLKNCENELLANENKSLKNHIRLLQGKLASFLNDNKIIKDTHENTHDIINKVVENNENGVSFQDKQDKLDKINDNSYKNSEENIDKSIR